MTRARPPLLLLLAACLAAALWPAPPAAKAQMPKAQIVVTETPCLHAAAPWTPPHVPARFAPHARLEVRLLPGSAMDQYLKAGDPDGPQSAHADDGDIDGVFETSPPRITLRVPAAGPPDPYTFAHEYGHYVWDSLLSAEDRRRYTALYARQKAARHLVTHYAGTDTVEGFAEAFSFYVSEPPLLQHRDPLSYQFLSQWPGP